VIFDMRLRGFSSMVRRVIVVPLSQMGMMPCGFVLAALMVLRGLAMMPRRMLMMFRCLVVMLGCFLGHC